MKENKKVGISWQFSHRPAAGWFGHVILSFSSALTAA